MKEQSRKLRPVAAAMMTCTLLFAGVAQAESADQALMAELVRDVKAAFLSEAGSFDLWLGILKTHVNDKKLKESTQESLNIVTTQYRKSCSKLDDIVERADSFSREDLRAGFAATVAYPIEWCSIRQRFMTTVEVFLGPEILGTNGITVGRVMETASKNMGAELVYVKRLQSEFITDLQGSLAAAGLSTDLKAY